MAETTSLLEIVAVPVEGFEEGNSQQSQIAAAASSSSSFPSSSSFYGGDDDNDIVREETNKEKRAPILLDGDWVHRSKKSSLLSKED